MGIIKSKIFKETGLLFQEYSGELNKNDMAVYFSGLYETPDYLNISIIFSDFTNATVTFSAKDVNEIAEFILTHAPKVRHINNAILVNEPLITAYSMIYEAIMKEMTLYNCKIFSTLKEAANFIGYDVNKLEIIMKSFLTDNIH
jgi:hypothetical protein